MNLLQRIAASKTIEETEALRMEVVRAYNQEITIAWQSKFWSFKKCSKCDRILDEEH
jgi:hypothetical protein